jgi:SulP family sulfate permease
MNWPLAPFHPRLLDSLQHYSKARFTKDLGAGLTVGVVALPLAMAFAIASGLPPSAGLWTAIIGGGLVSLLGGSSIQIGGPAGAFIVVVYGIIERFGVANLLIATILAGMVLFAMGLLRLGSLVRFVPISIIEGFTNGIAVLIGLSQLKDLLGLHIEHMPAEFFAAIQALFTHLDSFNPWALALGLGSFLGLLIWGRLWGPNPTQAARLRDMLGDLPGFKGASQTLQRLPGPVVALVSLTTLAWWADWPVETIGSRFGTIPNAWPTLAWPSFSWASARLLVGPTLTLAVLGAVESLLCARVADQMVDPKTPAEFNLKRHDPNQELMAQGLANFVTPFFGGMPATGTIARTVTNLRAGATSPIAGLIHALTLTTMVLLAAPLAMHIPLAVLSGILLFVAWNMGEWHAFFDQRKHASHHRLLLLGTFLLTVVLDLTVAMEVGLSLSCVLFVRRMGTLFEVKPQPTSQPDTQQFELYGALFFAAVHRIDELVEKVTPHTTFVLDAHHLIDLDTSGIDALRQLNQTLVQQGGALRIVRLQDQPMGLLSRSGLAHKMAECSLESAPSPTP